MVLSRQVQTYLICLKKNPEVQVQACAIDYTFNITSDMFEHLAKEGVDFARENIDKIKNIYIYRRNETSSAADHTFFWKSWPLLSIVDPLSGSPVFLAVVSAPLLCVILLLPMGVPETVLLSHSSCLYTLYLGNFCLPTRLPTFPLQASLSQSLP